MTKKQKQSATIFFILTILHTLFCNFYTQIYAFMNIQDWLTPFLIATLLLRLALLLALFWTGLRQVQKNRKLALFYLLLFFFNLVMIFAFY
ncbi:hypothetical protein [Tetragenococcus solitarius]|uniref:Uncharacterized protein n=1 Tax=Tetragenococcus solitarius TaxID=71453 RepID=A0ABN3Y7S0_9ENTE|nr:hypothetical protein [Tetragenococcus solitarius]